MPASTLPSGAWLTLAFLLIAGAALSRGKPCAPFLFAAVVALAGGWFTLRILETPATSLDRFLDHAPLAEPALIRVTGLIEDWPEDLHPPGGVLARFSRSGPATGLYLRVWSIQPPDDTDQTAQAIPASGRLWVRIAGHATDLPACVHPGEVVQVTGRVTPITPPHNPGEPDWTLLARQDGRVGTLAVPDASLIEPAHAIGVRQHAQALESTVLGRMRRFASSAFAATGSSSDVPPANREALERHDAARALLGAMLLGQRDPALAPVSAAFTRLGLLHLVAISGFNIAIMAGVALFLLRLTGDRGWIEPALLALLVIAYMLVLPAQAPILRAGLLVLALLIAEATGRRYDRATLLGWIAIALLIWKPMDLWSLGFELSLGIVAVLLIMGTRLHQRLFGVPLRGILLPPAPAGSNIPLTTRLHETAARSATWCSSAFKAQISASILAWALSLPILAWQTGVFSPLTPITTILVLPLTVLVLWVGYVALFIGALVPSAAHGVGWVLDRLATFLVDVVMSLDRVPGSVVHLPAVSVWWAVCATVVVLYWLWRGTLRDPVAWSLLSALLIWLVVEVNLIPGLHPEPPFRIDTLSVNDGTCHLLRSGGETMLWDAGSLNLGVGERLIPQAVRALGVSRVRTVLVTHAHIDHFAAVLDLLEPLGVRTLLISPQIQRAADADPSSAIAIVLRAAREHGVRTRVITQGDTFQLGVTRFDFLWPPKDGDFDDPNDSSLVAMLTVPVLGKSRSQRRVLMTGDISHVAIPALLPSATDPDYVAKLLKADVMEAPHHGAYIEPATELVRLVNPNVVVQSTGPRRARDQRWEPFKKDRRWFVTPVDGASWLQINEDGNIRSGCMITK